MRVPGNGRTRRHHHPYVAGPVGGVLDEDVVPDARDYSHDWFDDDGVAEGYGDNGVDTLLSCVTRDFAKCIVERRRTEEPAAPYFARSRSAPTSR